MNALHLWQKLIWTIDRAREYCGKECDIGSKLCKILAGYDMLAVNLNDIADQFECKEANTDGQDNIQSIPGYLKTYGTQYIGQ